MARAVSVAALLALAGAVFAACGTSGADGDERAAGGGKAGASGAGGSAGSGGQGGEGGGGGGVTFDAGLDDDAQDDAPEEACFETSAVSTAVTLPADIVWVVDQSGSMNQETDYVQQKINDFAQLIAVSGIDYHVVMIASPTGGNSICVPPPLGGPNCGDGPRFKLVDFHVESNDALQDIINLYPKYSSFLRPNAVKHFVIVTDDNSDMSAGDFVNALGALQPAGMFSQWKLHGIYAYGTPFIGCLGAFGTGAAVGSVYTDLITLTGGASGIICTGDWTQVFADITQQVVTGAQVACEYAVPSADAGTVDPGKVNVDFTPAGGMAQPVYRVNDQAGCMTGAGTGGWYFDDNASPTTIVFCPDTCTAVQGGAVDVKFGCASVYKPPK